MKYRFLKYRALQGQVTGRYYVGAENVVVDAPAGEFEGESETVIEIVNGSGTVQAQDSRAGEQPKRERRRRPS